MFELHGAMVKKLFGTPGPGRYRFALAFLVLMHHSTRVGLGAAAVYIFFCLSGYWMHAVWQERYSKISGGYLTFMVARYSRLLPMFWVCGLLAFFVAAYLKKVDPLSWLSEGHAVAEWVQLLGPYVFILGYNRQGYMVNVPGWSLDIEMQFYVLLPFLFFLVHALRWLVLPLAGAVAWCIVGTPLDQTVALYLSFFLLGMLCHCFRWTPSRRIAVAALILGVLWVSILVALPATRSVIIGGVMKNDMYRQWNEISNAVLAVIVLPLTVWTALLKSDAYDRMLGDMSYTLYLIHSPLLTLYAYWFGHLSALDRLPYWILMVGAVLIASWALWRWIDAPLIALRNRYLKEKSVTSSSACSEAPVAR